MRNYFIYVTLIFTKLANCTITENVILPVLESSASKSAVETGERTKWHLKRLTFTFPRNTSRALGCQLDEFQRTFSPTQISQGAKPKAGRLPTRIFFPRQEISPEINLLSGAC